MDDTTQQPAERDAGFVPIAPTVPQPVPQEHTSNMGTVSVWLSGIGIPAVLFIPFFGGAFSIAGFVIGLKGVSRAKHLGHSTTLPKIGWILGAVGMGIQLFYLVFFAYFFLMIALGR